MAAKNWPKQRFSLEKIPIVPRSSHRTYLSFLGGMDEGYKLLVQVLATAFLKDGLVDWWGRAEVPRSRQSIPEGR